MQNVPRSIFTRIALKFRDRNLTETEANSKRLSRRRRLVAAAYNNANIIRAAFVVVGYVWMALIPLKDMGRQTYIDENALQPGQVNTQWDWANVHQADRYLEQIEALRNASSVDRAEFIRVEFEKIGIPSATQSYTYKTVSKNMAGINAYASYAAPRASGAEAVIVSASWESLSRSSPSQRNRNERGIATILSLAAHIKRYSLWAKNFVFVIDDGHLDGMHAFLSAYHGFSQSNLIAEPIRLGSGGVVWTAICIDYPGHSFSHLGIFYEGVNGRLPNQDLLNSAQVIARWTGGMPVLVYDHLEETRADIHWDMPLIKQFNSFLNSKEIKEYELRAKNALAHVSYQFRGSPSGVHGLFHQFRIDAITLFAVPATGPHGFWSLGKVLESLLRTTNNLLERLHASYFFYLLTGPDTFVQLGKYVTAAILVGIGMELGGLKAWVDSGWTRDESSESATSSHMKKIGSIGSTPPASISTVNPPVWKRRRRPVLQALCLMISTHFFGWLTFILITSPWFINSLQSEVLSLPWIGAACFQALPILALLHPTIKEKLHTPIDEASVGELLHSFTLCIAGMTICLISVLNFSLAAVMAVFTGIPLSIGRPSDNLFARLCGFVGFAVLLPLGLLTTFAVMIGTDPVVRGVAESIWEWELLGVWFSPFVCVVYLPFILQALFVYVLP